MSDKPYFPLFVDLSEKDILFVGAGPIAARRVGVLRPFAGRITVVAPEAEEGIEDLAAGGDIAWIRRAFEDGDLDGRDMVFAVTDDPDLNEEIGTKCREKGILVNVASDKSLCDFYFPGIVQKGETVVGVSASGKDHKKARQLRERIEGILTEEIDRTLTEEEQ